MFGRIDFEEIAPNAPMQTVTFEFQAPDNSVIATRTMQIAPDGRFTLTNMPLEAHSLRVKAGRYLATKQLVTNNPGGVIIFLRTGDANNDNWVDVLDLHQIIRSFDAERGTDSRYNANADCNADGIVDMTDLGLFISNFDAEGDW